MSVYIIPSFFILILLLAVLKKLPAYDYFVNGAKQSIDLCINTFPCIIAIFMLISLLETSGVLEFFITKTASVWNFVGIPKDIVQLVILRPFTGSGSLAILTDVLQKYGTTGYISTCACVIMSSSDTLFYMLAIYFGSTKIKKTGAIIPISLISCLIGNIVACLFCRFI